MSEPQGHNSKDQLKSIVERIEKLDEEIKEKREDKSEIFAEAKGVGYDVKVLRKVIAIRKQDVNARQEQETILETYMQALGML